jgi:phage baseplate assembly protein W
VDLAVTSRVAATVRPDGTVARGAQALPEVTDLATRSDQENLAQALILRLLTPVGSLAALGHPSYGSRLHELIGQPKDSARRNLCRAFVLAAVADEPRVAPAAVAFAFDPAAERPDSFVFTVTVAPVAGGDPIGLTLQVGV